MTEIKSLTTNNSKTGLDDLLQTKQNSDFSFLSSKWLFSCSVRYINKNYTLRVLDSNWKLVFTITQDSKDSLRSKLIAIMSLAGFKETQEDIVDVNTLETTFSIDNEKTDFDSIQIKQNNLQDRIDQIKNTNKHKSFNIDSIYARIVLEDLGYSWNQISFKDKWVNWYLIKFNLALRELSEQDKQLAKKLEQQIKLNNYWFPVNLHIKKNKLVLEVAFYQS